MSDDDDDQHDFFSSQPDPPSREKKTALFFDEDEDDEGGEDEVETVNAAAIRSTGSKRKTVSQVSEPSKRTRRDSEGETGKKSLENSIKSESPPIVEWDKRFIGTFIIQAWSLSKGSNYVQHGDKVLIQRQKPKIAGQQIAAKSGKGAVNAGKKQTKLVFGSNGGSAGAAKKQKVKEDYVVRFSNLRGE
jgi:DNA repair protein RAD5